MMLTLNQLIWLVGAAAPITAWSWDNESTPISIFRSRPDLQAPILTPQQGLHDPEKMAPGYFFVAPYTNMQEAVYIYDNNADLVWTSFGSAGAGIAHAPRVCDYKGEKHLCFYQGVQHTGWGHGHGLILDKHYRIVKSVEPSGTHQTSSDMHEFYLIENGERALMTQYVRSVHDLCPWGACDGLGYINSGVFQEVDVETGEAVFVWNSLHHVGPEESMVLPTTTEISGDGESPETPWDYFHLNSIDKSSYDGSYLISARHTSAVYKIDGKTGRILWRLGGLKSDYEIGEGVAFAYQHDARWIKDSADESIISVFDNGGNGFAQPGPHSRGIIIKLDHRTKKAILMSSLDPPMVDGHGHVSRSQGNYQTDLSNGGSLMNWGNDPFFTEYAEDGEIVFYGALAYSHMMNYRTYKFDGWFGQPLSKPAIWTFSQHGQEDQVSNSNTMMVYVSWNGHTEIKTWNFYGSAERAGPWEVLIDGFTKKGFETIYKHDKTYRFVYAEAIDKDGAVLGKTEVHKTFVPNELMRERYCDELACFFMDTNSPEREAERQKMHDLWAAKNQNEENSDGKSVEDLYDAIYETITPRSVKILYASSFAILALVVVSVCGCALGRYHSISATFDKMVVMLRIKTRRRHEISRGKYAGVHVIGDDESEDEEYGDITSKQKNTSSRKETGVELEQQSFWRNRP